MRRPGSLVPVLVLAACASQPPAPPAPASGPPPTAPGPAPPPTGATMPLLQLTQDRPITLRSGVTLRHEGLVIEEIAAGPSPAYPGGSGVTMTLVVDGIGGGVAVRRPISLLSPGYTSQNVAWFGPYRVTVVDVKDPHRRDAVVELTVEETTDEVVPGAPIVATITRGGSLELGDATMIFVAHGHKRTRPGETSPLLLTVQYRVPGSETEEQHGELTGDPPRWTWRDRRFLVRDHAYNASMQLEVVRLRLAPLRP